MLHLHINAFPEGRLMLDKTTTTFSHVKPGATPWRSDSLRDFFFTGTWAWQTPLRGA